MKESYAYLPHTTDAYIEVNAQTLERAFEFAAQALFDTMCNINSIEVRVTEDMQAEGKDRIDLLQDWLEALLLKFELDGNVYSRFKLSPIERSGENIHLQGKIGGEPYDRKKHGSKVEVKAVTYHNMDVIEGPAGVRLTFILDL